MKKSLHVMIFIILLLSGCATKIPIISSDTYLITIKNKQMALSDTGFLNHGKDYINVQIFSVGAVLFNLEVQENVCLDGRCTSRMEFNKLFFEYPHYEAMINDILEMKPLYDGKNKVTIEGGFEQELDLLGSHISYKVQGKSLSFKDSKNGILIKLKELK
ncbi:MAG: hypothetical protein PHE60_02705 [Sulfurospirillaceae bacterium]|nr:hypothetical protein [Sulfurospirillaceae bacterium]